MVAVPTETWPKLSAEERPWYPLSETPRRRLAAYSGPYQAAVVPEIAAATPHLDSGTMADVADATAEIARFDTELGHDLAPFSALLLRSESAASSRIEHLTASAKAIALAELGDGTTRNATDIVANTRAMNAAIDLADRLDAGAIIEMHAALLERRSPRMTGQWRQQQVWIGTGNHGPHTASFVPPHHDRVPAAIDDLVVFMRRDDLPVLVQAAIAHAQFETIHPFPDGNGRAGRALVHSLLRAKGLTRSVTVPVSAGLLVDVDSYFEALTEYRRGNPQPIVGRFSDAALWAIANGRRLVEDLRQIREAWRRLIVARPQAVVWQVVDVALQHPVLDSGLVQRELDVSASAADGGIKRLADLDVLSQVTDGRRNRKWAAQDVLDALDEFAERGGRRSGGG